VSFYNNINGNENITKAYDVGSQTQKYWSLNSHVSTLLQRRRISYQWCALKLLQRHKHMT